MWVTVVAAAGYTMFTLLIRDCEYRSVSTEMFEKSLQKALQTRRFVVREATDSGWEVRDERDSTTLRRAIYHDWHRVERAISAFQDEEASLRADGWVAPSI
jgi:hypothetical protein